MRASTQLFLYHLLWSAERLSRPTFRNLTDSFEAWAYHSGLRHEIARLEKQKLIERKAGKLKRVFRLTEQGRLAALGGRDPGQQWARPWDKKWRLVSFDIPTSFNSQRVQLRRYLCDRNFGCLQKSLWITPDPLVSEIAVMGRAKVDTGSLLFFEAKACAGESDKDIVREAWDFERINALYQKHLTILKRRPTLRSGKREHARRLRNWAAEEFKAWGDVMVHDPLLPRALLPEGYLGMKSWRRRIETLARARRDVADFDWNQADAT